MVFVVAVTLAAGGSRRIYARHRFLRALRSAWDAVSVKLRRSPAGELAPDLAAAAVRQLVFIYQLRSKGSPL